VQEQEQHEQGAGGASDQDAHGRGHEQGTAEGARGIQGMRMRRMSSSWTGKQCDRKV
jgi:hypothetical protein